CGVLRMLRVSFDVWGRIEPMTTNSDGNRAERRYNTNGLRPWKPGQSGNPRGRPKGQRSTAIAVLAKLGDQNAWVQCYRMAEQQKDVRAMVEILRYLTDRRDGKAYVAENPATSQKSDALQQDTRLQAAIPQLIPAWKAAFLRRKPQQ